MIIKYLEETELFGGDIDKEIIEIKVSGLCITIDGILQADSMESAINKFFETMQEEEKKSRRIELLRIKFQELQKQAMATFNKNKKKEEIQFNGPGYSWSIDNYADDFFHVWMKIDIFHNNVYIKSLESAVNEYQNWKQSYHNN